jgi:hypothetical protein
MSHLANTNPRPQIPNYGTPTSRTRSGRLKDLSWLRDKLSFLGFCRDVTQTNAARNGKPGFVVGRKLMEAAWAQLLVMTLVKQMDVGVDFYELREVFLVCLLQVCALLEKGSERWD